MSFKYKTPLSLKTVIDEIATDETLANWTDPQIFFEIQTNSTITNAVLYIDFDGGVFGFQNTYDSPATISIEEWRQIGGVWKFIRLLVEELMADDGGPGGDDAENTRRVLDLGSVGPEGLRLMAYFSTETKTGDSVIRFPIVFHYESTGIPRLIVAAEAP